MNYLHQYVDDNLFHFHLLPKPFYICISFTVAYHLLLLINMNKASIPQGRRRAQSKHNPSVEVDDEEKDNNNSQNEGVQIYSSGAIEKHVDIDDKPKVSSVRKAKSHKNFDLDSEEKVNENNNAKDVNPTIYASGAISPSSLDLENKAKIDNKIRKQKSKAKIDLNELVEDENGKDYHPHIDEDNSLNQHEDNVQIALDKPVIQGRSRSKSRKHVLEDEDEEDQKVQ